MPVDSKQSLREHYKEEEHGRGYQLITWRIGEGKRKEKTLLSLLIAYNRPIRLNVFGLFSF